MTYSPIPSRRVARRSRRSVSQSCGDHSVSYLTGRAGWRGMWGLWTEEPKRRPRECGGGSPAILRVVIDFDGEREDGDFLFQQVLDLFSRRLAINRPGLGLAVMDLPGLIGEFFADILELAFHQAAQIG